MNIEITKCDGNSESAKKIQVYYKMIVLTPTQFFLKLFVCRYISNLLLLFYLNAGGEGALRSGAPEEPTPWASVHPTHVGRTDAMIFGAGGKQSQVSL